MVGNEFTYIMECSRMFQSSATYSGHVLSVVRMCNLRRVHISTSICCSGVDRVVEKKEEESSALSCIIDHKGFIYGMCLDVWVLQTAYFNYWQHYGVAEEKAVHE